MPNPTPARRTAGSPYSYKVDPVAPSRDTIPCPHCGTTLSNCDWFPDHLGRLFLRCPNAHRHGTGWRAHPEPKEVPVWKPCKWVGCVIEIPVFQSRTGQVPEYCDAHRVEAQRRNNREYAKRKAAAEREARRYERQKREAASNRLRQYWQTKDGAA